jgi:glycosyltransferase involved in cell wall biosynthesis
MEVLKASGRQDADWLPHGYFGDIFFPCRNRDYLSMGADEVWVGCVMANQARKDFPEAFECFAYLKQVYGNKFRGWIHTSSQIGYWNLYALAADYGVSDCVMITTVASDPVLALWYSSCDCTILPTAGEGFGYPIVESMACGTPCVTTGYAAGCELVLPGYRVTPQAFRVDTQHNVLRAVLDGGNFGYIAEQAINSNRVDPEGTQDLMVGQVQHLEWDKLKIQWMKWLRRGL